MADEENGPDEAQQAAGDAISERAPDLAAGDAIPEQVADLAAEDAIVERAAELATEVTEADKAADRRRGTASSGGRLAAQVVAMAQRLRIRDQAALRAQFPGKSSEEIADALIEGASRASAAVGGAVGAWAALPVLPAY